MAQVLSERFELPDGSTARCMIEDDLLTIVQDNQPRIYGTSVASIPLSALPKLS